MLKTVKFGGTSLANAEQFRKCAAIVQAEDDRRYVVVSAPGKRSGDDIKVTDLLYSGYLLGVGAGLTGGFAEFLFG